MNTFLYIDFYISFSQGDFYSQKYTIAFNPWILPTALYFLVHKKTYMKIRALGTDTGYLIKRKGCEKFFLWLIKMEYDWGRL